MKRDYATWKPEEHYCIECGVRHVLYDKGEKIHTAFGESGYIEEAVVPCSYCGEVVDFGSWGWELRPDCKRKLEALSDQGWD